RRGDQAPRGRGPRLGGDLRGRRGGGAAPPHPARAPAAAAARAPSRHRPAARGALLRARGGARRARAAPGPLRPHFLTLAPRIRCADTVRGLALILREASWLLGS